MKAGPGVRDAKLSPTPEDHQDATEYFGVYAEYSKTLRVWLVSYGIGAPVLLATSDRLSAAIFSSRLAGWIGFLFLLGVAMQVILAVINKHTMWALYYGAVNPEYRPTRRYRFASWLAEQYWVDVILDLTAFALFGAASWLAILEAAAA